MHRSVQKYYVYHLIKITNILGVGRETTIQTLNRRRSYTDNHLGKPSQLATDLGIVSFKSIGQNSHQSQYDVATDIQIPSSSRLTIIVILKNNVHWFPSHQYLFNPTTDYRINTIEQFIVDLGIQVLKLLLCHFALLLFKVYLSYQSSYQLFFIVLSHQNSCCGFVVALKFYPSTQSI